MSDTNSTDYETTSSEDSYESSNSPVRIPTERRRRGRPRKNEQNYAVPQQQYKPVDMAIYNSPLGSQYVPPRPFATPIDSRTHQPMGYTQLLYRHMSVNRGYPLPYYNTPQQTYHGLSGYNNPGIPTNIPRFMNYNAKSGMTNSVMNYNTSINANQGIVNTMVHNRSTMTKRIRRQNTQQVIKEPDSPPRRRRRSATIMPEPIMEIEEEEEDDESNIEDDGIEKLLSHNEENDTFYVKFRGKSYLHCDWVSREEIEQSKAGSLKIKRFRPKTDAPFDPDYIKVDRILFEDFEGEKTFLVKWKKLPYELSSFEYEEILHKCEGFREELEKYYKRKSLRVMRYPIDWRPPREYFLKFEESPKFCNDNSLRKYQIEGLNWLLNRWYFRQSCIMADEMGLGKTVQTVTFVDTLFRKYDFCAPVLVVAPLSTIIHWEREFTTWTDLRVLVLHATLAGREIIYEYEFYSKNNNNIKNDLSRNCTFLLFDVLITTYEVVISDYSRFQEIKFGVGIFDEAHRLKNSNSKAAQSLRNLYFNHKILLSGTPLQNNLQELWSLLNFIDPIRHDSCQRFLNEFKMEKTEDVDKLQSLLRPLMLRRMKDDVEKSIPPKEETIIEVELTMIQKKFYRAILEKNIEFLTKGNNGPNLLNAMMELRKCCIHPFLIKGAEEKIFNDYRRGIDKNNMRVSNENEMTNDEYFKILIQSSGKLVLLDKLLNKLKGKHKVLIFSQMTSCLDLLGEYLSYRKYSFERIDGGVRGECRQAAIDRFSAMDSEIFVFLLCTRAGGVGINLTAADTVIIFDSDWNPQNDLQAQARCHRIGQTNEVKIYRLITRNTYEREMFDRAGRKLGLDRAVLQRMGCDKLEVNEKRGDAIEILLRKGAYGVLMENDEACEKFCEEDIDQILERRTRVIRHEDSGNAFSKATFQVDEEIDDPDFWENLLAKKKNEEGEMRVKRQVRKLSREGSVNKEEILEILSKISDSTEDLYLWVFLTAILKGRHNINDNSAIFNSVVSYCIDLVQNPRLKDDLSYALDDFIVKYDFINFKIHENIYRKYHEVFLLRIQAVAMIEKLMDGEVEKGRGWSLEDDKKLIDWVLKNGYDNYESFSIKGKTVDDMNQRIRKMILLWNKKKELVVEDQSDVAMHALCIFGRKTNLNEKAMCEFLNYDSNKIDEVEELTSKVDDLRERKRRKRLDEEKYALCMERITLFDKLAEIEELSEFKRTVGVSRKWNLQNDRALREAVLERGIQEGVLNEFGIEEECAIKRIESMIKYN
ncbi:Chromodomain-helicase-DNA-binding protein 8 [Astathelohania contejeani]|uniref:Chromodomain-helicase-DNA-binding protein 8 n=1 Tax=Astathelohania contejeani TaxID=164912 RepID=A0ABQ7I276_9MICR|nr:Chromodomain-helicase-DNA-binding protein 8 [Thelohania contejeani]